MIRNIHRTAGLVFAFALVMAVSFALAGDPVPVEQAKRAALTYMELGEAQFGDWADAEPVLNRTYFGLDSQPTAYEFAVVSSGESLGRIVIGGNRDFPPLIQFSDGPSPVDLGVELGVVPDDRKPVYEAVLKPGAMVPLLMSPEYLHIFVAGGAPGCAFSLNYLHVPPYNRTAIMTRAITGATLTKAGK